MSDILSKERRSSLMRQVKSRQNKSTEIKLISYFRKSGIIGWRRNSKIYGNPDFVFPKEKVAVFADGCFWHGHNCRNTTPSSNKEFWQKKLKGNQLRDKKVNAYLRSKNWKVIRIWECDLKNSPKKFIRKIKKALCDTNLIC